MQIGRFQPQEIAVVVTYNIASVLRLDGRWHRPAAASILFSA
jgi:hypothetical protein